MKVRGNKNRLMAEDLGPKNIGIARIAKIVNFEIFYLSFYAS